MDFPSSGVSRHHQSHHQSAYRNSSVHNSLFSSPNSIFGSQPPAFNSNGSSGCINPVNQFNFPLRSRQLTVGGLNGCSNSIGQYSSFRGNEGVLRQPSFGSGSGQNNFKSNRQIGNGGPQNGKTGKDKVPRDFVKANSASGQRDEIQQQYRIFKRGDIFPGGSSSIGNILPTSPRASACTTADELAIGTSHDGQRRDTISEIGQDSNVLIGDSPNVLMGSGSENLITNSPNSKENQNTLNSSGNNSRTTVSLVSEIAKFHGLQLEYRLVKETGPPHAPTFTVNLTLGTEKYEGSGSSIKRAQHAAATEALENTSFLKPPPRTQSRRNYTGGGGSNYQKKPNWALIQLTSLAEDMKEPLSFALQPIQIIDPYHRRETPSVVTVHVGCRTFTGEGHTFNAAKNTAAMIALKTLIREKQEIELARMLSDGTTAFQLEEANLNSENKSPISIVHEMAMKRGLTVSFDVTNESGPPHMKVFTVKCIVGDFQTEGQGSTKQQAKKISSEMMMSKLREISISLPNTPGNTIKAIQRGLAKPKVTKKKTAPVLKDIDKQLVSPISRLIQIAHTKKLKEPEFRLVAQPEVGDLIMLSQGNKNDRRNKRKKTLFTIEVSVGSQVCQGTAMNKKEAKKAAADAALIALGCSCSLSDVVQAAGITEHNISNSASETINIGSPAEPSSQPSSPLKAKQRSNISPRQLVPGLLVLKNEASSPSPPLQSAKVAQELIRVNSSMCAGSTSHEGLDKLNYLAQLLELKVSFSDFPKKNEFLSVVSFGATPPHVAHGIGKSLEEARNSAAQKILDELTDMGLDNVTNKTEVNGATSL